MLQTKLHLKLRGKKSFSNIGKKFRELERHTERRRQQVPTSSILSRSLFIIVSSPLCLLLFFPFARQLGQSPSKKVNNYLFLFLPVSLPLIHSLFHSLSRYHPSSLFTIPLTYLRSLFLIPSYNLSL